MWKDEFPPNIKREIGDRAVRNQASILCPQDGTKSKSLRNYATFMSTLQEGKGQAAKIVKKYKNVRDSLQAKCVDAYTNRAG